MPKVTLTETKNDRVVIAALERAVKVMSEHADERAAKGAPDSPEPGTHVVKLTIAVEGDVVVLEPATISAVEAVEGVTVSDQELLAAILLGADHGEFERMIGLAMRRLAKSRGIGDTNTKAKAAEVTSTLESAKETLARILEDKAKAASLWGTVKKGRKAGSRAGAVTGKPAVSIEGSIDDRAVEVAVESVTGAIAGTVSKRAA